MTLRSLLAKTAGLLLAASLAAPASAAEVEIRLGWVTTDLPTDAYNYAAHAFADALEAAKPGHFDVKFFPNRALGDEAEMLQGMQLGTVDSAMITNPHFANIERAFTINDMPFLYSTTQQAFAILDGPLGDELFAKLAPRSVVGLAWCDSGFRNMINRTRPINAPEDLAGLKIRVIPSPLFVAMFEQLGAAGVPMPVAELYTAMQQGTIDGMENPIWSILANKFYEPNKYLSLTRHIFSTTPLAMSARKFDSLSAEDQAVVKAAARKACEQQRIFTNDNERKNIEELQRLGIEVNEVADTSAFQSKMQPIYDEYRAVIGEDLMDRWLAAVKQ